MLCYGGPRTLPQPGAHSTLHCSLGRSRPAPSGLPPPSSPVPGQVHRPRAATPGSAALGCEVVFTSSGAFWGPRRGLAPSPVSNRLACGPLRCPAVGTSSPVKCPPNKGGLEPSVQHQTDLLLDPPENNSRVFMPRFYLPSHCYSSWRHSRIFVIYIFLGKCPILWCLQNMLT